MLGKLTFFAGCSYLAYALYHAFRDTRAHRATRRMSTDNDGNYDLDGVSYDPQSHIVSVSGDNRIPDPVETVGVTQEVVKLHAPETPKKRSVSA